MVSDNGTLVKRLLTSKEQRKTDDGNLKVLTSLAKEKESEMQKVE